MFTARRVNVSVRVAADRRFAAIIAATMALTHAHAPPYRVRFMWYGACEWYKEEGEAACRPSTRLLCGNEHDGVIIETATREICCTKCGFKCRYDKSRHDKYVQTAKNIDKTGCCPKCSAPAGISD